MMGTWLQDLESFEAISQDADAREIFLRMAALSREGQMGSFLTELADDEDLDDETKGTLTELAHDSSFLLAVEEVVLHHVEASIRIFDLEEGTSLALFASQQGA